VPSNPVITIPNPMQFASFRPCHCICDEFSKVTWAASVLCERTTCPFCYPRSISCRGRRGRERSPLSARKVHPRCPLMFLSAYSPYVDNVFRGELASTVIGHGQIPKFHRERVTRRASLSGRYVHIFLKLSREYLDGRVVQVKSSLKQANFEGLDRD
jgi:hypothetical protein